MNYSGELIVDGDWLLSSLRFAVSVNHIWRQARLRSLKKPVGLQEITFIE